MIVFPSVLIKASVWWMGYKKDWLSVWNVTLKSSKCWNFVSHTKLWILFILSLIDFMTENWNVMCSFLLVGNFLLWKYESCNKKDILLHWQYFLFSSRFTNMTCKKYVRIIIFHLFWIFSMLYLLLLVLRHRNKAQVTRTMCVERFCSFFKLQV